MKSLETRLGELILSAEYKRDFEEVKSSLLREKRPKMAGLRKSNPKNVPLGKENIIFYSDTIKQSKKYHQYDVPVKEVQEILKKGNINDHSIEIPYEYHVFASKWGLSLLFDPTKRYQFRFDPFSNVPIVVFDFMEDCVNWKVDMRVDLRYPNKMLEKRFKELIYLYKPLGLCLSKEEEKTRERNPFSDELVYEVRNCLRQGITKPAEVFRKIYPDYKDRSLFGGKKDTREYNLVQSRYRVIRKIIKMETFAT